MTLLKKTTNLLLPHLESMGFKKRSTGIFTKDLADGFVGWLGLNQAKHKQGIEINPVVGIRCQKLEQALSSLLKETPHKYGPPTISISLGYLMPGKSYRSWIFDNEVDNETLMDLVEAIDRYGVPFMETTSEIGKMDAFLGSPKFGHFEQVMYRRPMAKWLLGDAKGALQICAEYCQKLDQRSDMVAEKFRSFARAFESLVNQVDT